MKCHRSRKFSSLQSLNLRYMACLVLKMGQCTPLGELG
jgi:hypothetical protein